MKVETYKLHPEENTVEINGTVYYDGQAVKKIRKNFIVFSYNYKVLFYGIKDTGVETFKHFLTVRFLLKEYNWTFRTKHMYSELPYTEYKNFKAVDKIKEFCWNCYYRLRGSKASSDV